MDQRDEIIQIFITESRENIDMLDQGIVRLETEPDNGPLLDEIFRAFHTLKGNSGIVGMQRFEKVAHVTEEVLTEIRDGKRKINSEIITFLLDSLDQLKILHSEIEETGTDAAEVKVIPEPPKGKTSRIQKPSKSRKTATKAGTKKTTAAKGKKSKKTTPEELAEDGSWGIFTENLESDKKALASPSADAGTTQDSEKIEQKKSSKTDEVAVADSQKTSEQTATQKDAPQQWGKGDSTIRVDVGLLDSVMNMVGELVLSRNQIMQYATQIENANFHAASQRLNLCTSELQESVMKTRMQPIANVFNRFPRLVRDVAPALNKKVQLKLEGAETELDKTLIEGIKDPLTHLVRNSLDHGIEDTETRKRAGKDEKGTLILRAYHEGGQVNLEIIDDGAGIDPEIIRQKLVEKNLLTVHQAKELSDRDTVNQIFRPGFSTAKEVTKISGRGVGMDVVKTNIEKIGGNVEISSVVGKGTTVKIKIPLTLAIIPALVVTTGEQRFAIPQINLLELVRLEGDDLKNIERIGNAEIYRLRGKLLPILRLNKVLELQSASEDSESLSIVVLAAGETQFGLIVDQIHDTEEIVVKPLSKHLKDILAFAGATVMGDGKVALILDIVGLADTAKVMLAENHGQLDVSEQIETYKNQSQTLLLFSVHPEEQLAIPLSLVSRLETVDSALLTTSGNREVIKYRGKILPLVRVENYLKIKAPQPKDTITIIAFSVEGNEVGFVVSEIIDIINSDAEVDTASLQQKGILGSSIINQKITLIIDAYTLIAGEFPEWFKSKSQKKKTQTRGNSNVLVVDDSPFIRAIERSYLEPEGYSVIEATDGDQALELMMSEDIDLIVTDIAMPGMDGLELTRNIRANEVYKDMPIVVVSSLGSAQDVERGMEAGADVYLEKLDRQQLLASLEKVISEHKR